MNIGERIRQLRLEINLNQADFAEHLGIGQAALSALEKGIRNVTDRNISLICDKFSVSENWLRTGEGEMFEAKTRSEEIVIWAAKLAQKENSDFPKRFAAMLTKLNDEEWKTLEKMALMLLEENKKD